MNMPFSVEMLVVATVYRDVSIARLKTRLSLPIAPVRGTETAAWGGRYLGALLQSRTLRIALKHIS